MHCQLFLLLSFFLSFSHMSTLTDETHHMCEKGEIIDKIFIDASRQRSMILCVKSKMIRWPRKCTWKTSCGSRYSKSSKLLVSDGITLFWKKSGTYRLTTMQHCCETGCRKKGTMKRNPNLHFLKSRYHRIMMADFDDGKKLVSKFVVKRRRTFGEYEINYEYQRATCTVDMWKSIATALAIANGLKGIPKPPPIPCVLDRDACGASSTCCSGVSCDANGFCNDFGDACTSNADCKASDCVSGTCRCERRGSPGDNCVNCCYGCNLAVLQCADPVTVGQPCNRDEQCRDTGRCFGVCFWDFRF